MRWKMKTFSVALATELASELGLFPIVAGVMAARGIHDVKDARVYMNPSLSRDWSDPRSIEGMQEVAERLKLAVDTGKRIGIFGDYDVDGITASAIMFNTLRALGSTPEVILPLREGEGYGLTDSALERVFALGLDVLLTVDCGVSSKNEVRSLQQRGIEVLITDHHEASGAIPEGVPLADPKLARESAASILAGAGVALKLAALLGEACGKPDLWLSQLDLAALGTIADCMPLIQENRSLVAQGVKELTIRPRPGITALLNVSRLGEGALTTEMLSFGLIPRLNAAGRVSDPMISFDLLSTQDPQRATYLAEKLNALNTERKALEASLFAVAVKQIEPFPDTQRSIVVGGEDWHEGVKGIIASRLVRRYGVPTIVFSFADGLAVGSGRSVGSIDLHAAVSGLSDMLEKFGGHQAAIGVTLKQERFAEFAERFEAYMHTIPSEDFEDADEIDCEIGLGQLSLESVEELSVLEPFGVENPEPRFLAKGLMLSSVRFVGADKRHIQLTLSDGLHEFSAIWFNAPYKDPETPPSTADVVFRVQIDEWRGKRRIKLQILDIIAAEAGELEEAGGLEEAGELGETYTGGRSSAAHGENSAGDRNSAAQLEQLLYLGSESSINQRLASVLSGGEVTLRAAQTKCLETLARGESTLAVMATGRGKSLIFQVHAIKLALREKRPSLFLYPLRSLINDQEFFLKRALSAFGLTAASLVGATPREERIRIEQQVKEGSVNIVLSTPEFVFANASKMTL